MLAHYAAAGHKINRQNYAFFKSHRRTEFIPFAPRKAE